MSSSEPGSIIYEPIPLSCTPSHLETTKKIFPSISIFSPNHEEAALLLSLPSTTPTENLADRFASLGAQTVIIRAGPRGSYILNSNPTFGPTQGKWVPAYWNSDEASTQVKSTTGAGNSFLGGLCAGLELTGNDILMGTHHYPQSQRYLFIYLTISTP
jgi:sugar/nucleoside kinase (ribokinase family)